MTNISTDQLSPSQILLLRGDRFVHQRGKLVLPTGASVSMQAMAEKLMTVAFLACAAQNIMELQIQTQETLFGLWTVQKLLVIPHTTDVPWPKTSLEARLTQLAAHLLPENRCRVQSLVHVFLGEDSPYPWRQIVAIAQGGLVAQGVLAHIDEAHWSMFEHRKKLHLARPTCGSLDDLDCTVPEALLVHYAQATPQIWHRLRQEIAWGIGARNKRPHPLRENRQRRIKLINEHRPFNRF